MHQARDVDGFTIKQLWQPCAACWSKVLSPPRGPQGSPQGVPKQYIKTHKPYKNTQKKPLPEFRTTSYTDLEGEKSPSPILALLDSFDLSMIFFLFDLLACTIKGDISISLISVVVRHYLITKNLTQTYSSLLQCQKPQSKYISHLSEFKVYCFTLILPCRRLMNSSFFPPSS